jgi:hypothetical protein
MSEIELRDTKDFQGLVTMVDDRDYDWLMDSAWRQWYPRVDINYVRARRVYWYYPKEGGPRKVVSEYMSRVIWAHHNGPIPEKMVIDHANQDGLDNRLENLRCCTHTQNCHNRRIGKNSSSQYVGVSYSKNPAVKNKWRAMIGGLQSQSIGYYPTEIEAAKAYDKVCLELRGEFAVLNFPDE